MDKNSDLSISTVQNRIKDETKHKFDALLKQALTSKSNKNVQNISARIPVSDMNSLTSSNEDLQSKSNLNRDKRKPIEVVKGEVHESSTHDNYILNKFLNDSHSAEAGEEVLSIDVNDPDVMFIKPPVPRPRRHKKIAKPLSSPTSSSGGTYRVNSPVTAKDINNSISMNELQITKENLVYSKTVADIPLAHKTRNSNLSDVNQLNVTKPDTSDRCERKNNKESEKSDSETIKNDEIEYENEIKPKRQKKQAKKSLLENKNTPKYVVETLIEDQKQFKYTYEKIIGITVHKTDRLKLDSLVIHPVVKVHIVNAETGEYLNKSDKSRPVVFFYENKDILFISPIISEPYNLYEKHSLYPSWEETLILNEDINFLLNSENNSILFFEIMDFVSFSIANSQFYQRGSSRGWHKIAWAFLKPVGKNNELNIDKKVRLQLYYTSKDKKVAPHICSIYHWWKNKKLLKYPSSLYVSVKGIIPPAKVMETLRSKTPIQGEKGSRINLDADIEKDVCENASVNPICTQKNDKNGSEVTWDKSLYKTFKFPNKCIAELATYEEGCLMLQFSNNGLYLAAAVLIDDTYSIIIFSVKSFKEICKYSGHQGLIYNISWSYDDQIIVTASADCTACIWNFTRRAFVEMLPHPSYVYASEISSTNLIATGCYDNVIRLWCCKSNTAYDLIQELEAHEGYVTSLCFNKKSTCMYSSDSLGTIIEWKNSIANANWSLKREIKLVDLRATIINQILLHTRERKLLIHARDSTLRLIDLKTGYVLHWLQGAVNNRFNTTCSFSACGNYVFAGSENGFINVWNTDTGKTVATYTPYDAFHYQNLTINCVRLHPQDSILAIAHYGHSLPVLLTIYDSVLHGKSNVGLKIFQNDGEILSRKTKPVESFKLAVAKVTGDESDSHEKRGKIKFEDVIEKIDKIIISQSSVSNSAADNLLN